MPRSSRSMTAAKKARHDDFYFIVITRFAFLTVITRLDRVIRIEAAPVKPEHDNNKKKPEHDNKKKPWHDSSKKDTCRDSNEKISVVMI